MSSAAGGGANPTPPFSEGRRNKKAANGEVSPCQEAACRRIVAVYQAQLENKAQLLQDEKDVTSSLRGEVRDLKAQIQVLETRVRRRAQVTERVGIHKVVLRRCRSC